MSTSRKRALTWALVALGIAMVVLGGVMVATFPWDQWGPQAQAAAQAPGGAPGTAPGTAPGFGPWHGPFGYPHWGYYHGPRFFGGGLLFIAVIIFVVVMVARRARYHRYYRSDRFDGPDERGPEEILRRTFAEGKITEEEYTSRLAALRT